MKTLLLLFIISLILMGCSKSSDPAPNGAKKFTITINSTDPLKVHITDGGQVLVQQSNIIPPFTYSFEPNSGDQIGITITYNNNIAITESYNGKTDHADLAIQVAPKTTTGGTVQYYYPIP